MNNWLSLQYLKKIGVKLFGNNIKVSKYAKIYNPSKLILHDNIRIDDFTILSGSGNIEVNNNVHKVCYYPSYQFLIDWNGDIFLCPQDWQRRITMGNMMQQTIYEIWMGKIFEKYRKNLLEGKRVMSPCSLCNAEGTILGKNHAKEWNKIYKI